MNLSQFDGGLNTRKAPSLINVNQGVEYENIDNESGLLTPVKQKSSSATTAFNAYGVKFEGAYVSSATPTEYLDYSGKLYSVNGSTPLKSDDGVSFQKLGIAGPATKCSGVATNQPSGPNDYSLSLIQGNRPQVRFNAVIFGIVPSTSVDFALALIAGTSTEAMFIPFDVTTPSSSGPNYEVLINLEKPPLDMRWKVLFYTGAVWVQAGDDVYGAEEVTIASLFSPSATYTVTSEDTLNTGSIYQYGVINNNGTKDSVVVSKTIATPANPDARYTAYIADFNGLSGTSKLLRKFGTTWKEYGTITSASKVLDRDSDGSAYSSYTLTSGLDGTYQYVYTYYNSADGTESKPSPVSDEIVVAEGSVALSGLVASADTQVDTIRIYRTGGTLTAFTLVDEISNGVTTYNDAIKDINVEGDILASEFYEECPVEARYIVESYAVAFVAAYTEGTTKLSTLRFSEIGNFNYWPEANAIEFPDVITGLGVTSEGVVVFTQYRSWIISGTSPDTFTRYDLSNDQGCINHHTIAGIGNSILFASTDGICSTQGGSVKVLSKDVLGRQTYSTTNAALHDEIYYLHLSDGSILAMDFRYGPVFKKLSLGTARVFNFDDTIYGLSSGSLYALYGSATDATMTYKSPLLTNAQYTNLKAVKDIYVSYTSAAMTLKIYIDGTLIHTESLSGTGVTDIKVPQITQRGYTVQYEVAGTGTLNEIEYLTLDRQNGR